MKDSGELHHSSMGSEKNPKKNASSGLKRRNAVTHGRTSRIPEEKPPLNRESSNGDENKYTVRGVKTFSVLRDDTLPKSPTLPASRSKSVPPNSSRNSVSSTTPPTRKARESASSQDQVPPGAGKLRRGPKLSLQIPDDQGRVREQVGRGEATIQTMQKARPSVVFVSGRRNQRRLEGENPAVARPRTEDGMTMEYANERRPQGSPTRRTARAMKPSPLRDSTSSTTAPSTRRDEKAAPKGPQRQKTSSLPAPKRERPKPEQGKIPPPVPPRPDKGQNKTSERQREVSPSSRRPTSGRDGSPVQLSRFHGNLLSDTPSGQRRVNGSIWATIAVVGERDGQDGLTERDPEYWRRYLGERSTREFLAMTSDRKGSGGKGGKK